MKERDLRALEDRLESLSERLVELEDGQARAGQGAGDVAQAVRDLAAGMRRQDRVLSLNSFVAYLLFTVLLCATFFFLFRGRADDVAAELDRAVAARDAVQARADAAVRQLAEREAADRASAEVLELLRRHRYAEAITAHRKVTGLGPAQRQFLADAVDGARAELAAETAVRARQAFDRRDYKVAHETAKQGLALAPEGEPANELRYILAASLDKLGRTGEAQAAYSAFLEAAPEHVMAPRARQRLRRPPVPGVPEELLEEGALAPAPDGTIRPPGTAPTSAVRPSATAPAGSVRPAAPGGTVRPPAPATSVRPPAAGSVRPAVAPAGTTRSPGSVRPPAPARPAAPQPPRR